MAEPGKPPKSLPSVNTPSLSFKSASEVVLEDDEPLPRSSPQKPDLPAATRPTDSDVAKHSPSSRRRSGAVSSQLLLVQPRGRSEEASTVGGEDAGMIEELSSSPGGAGRMSARRTLAGKDVGPDVSTAVARKPSATTQQPIAVVNGKLVYDLPRCMCVCTTAC